MNISPTMSEAQIRAAIASADEAARQELALARLCRDPVNIEWRRKTADIYRELACDYRHVLAEHVLLEGTHQMTETVQ